MLSPTVKKINQSLDGQLTSKRMEKTIHVYVKLDQSYIIDSFVKLCFFYYMDCDYIYCKYLF